MKGIVLLPVLLVMTALALLVLAEAQWGASERREEQHLLWQEQVRGALDYGLAVLESRLRRRLEDPTPPRPQEIFAEGEDSGLSFELSYPPPELGEDQMEPIQVSCRVRPPIHGESVDCIARDPQDGRPAAVIRSLLHLPETNLQTLAKLLEPHFQEPGPRVAAGNWLASLLHQLWRESPESWDNAAWRERFAELYVQRLPPESELRAYLEEQLPALQVGLDPYSRLRRTNAHPSRVAGKDRGAYRLPGGPVSPRLSGRFVLEAELPGKSPGSRHEARRTVTLLKRTELRFQEDWVQGEVQLHDVCLGPEVISDAEYAAGEAIFIAATEPCQLQSFAWRALATCALAVGPAMGVTVGTTGSEMRLRFFPLPESLGLVGPTSVVAPEPHWFLAGNSGQLWQAHGAQPQCRR